MLLALPAATSLFSASESSASRAQRFCEKLRSAEKAPALCAAVWKAGSIVWSRAVGESDLEDGAPATPQTLFRIGSVSKLLTAAAAARLFERGALDLDAPIQRYVPSFPEKSGQITPRLLLGHLSGVRHYSAGEYLNSKRYTSVGDTLAAIRDAPLLHAPGSKYSYSSYGFNLLGAALERAASQDFASLIRRDVLQPLGMQRTIPDDHRAILAGRARYYSLSDGRIENAPDTDLSDRLPSGGYLSTAEELVRFGGAHLAGVYLNPATRTLMFTSQRTTEGKETGVGLGWRIGAVANRRVYHHGGDAIGGRAFILLRPDDSMAVALTSNLGFARFAEREAMSLADCFFS